MMMDGESLGPSVKISQVRRLSAPHPSLLALLTFASRVQGPFCGRTPATTENYADQLG